IRGMRIGTVDEGEQRLIGIARRLDDAVRKHELAELAMVERAGRLDVDRFEPGRRGRRVRIKRRLVDRPWTEDRSAPAAGPEAVADHFVRVRLAHEGRPFPRRRRPSGKARDGKIEAAPEEMDRTRLADELASRPGEDALTPHQDVPERFD